MTQKTKILIALCAFALAIAGLFVVQELRARSWETRWHAFLSRWNAQGEIFDPAKLIPAEGPAEQDFVRHPYIQLVANRDSRVLETLEKMKPEQVNGYKAWFDDTQGDGARNPMSPELARRVLDYVASFDAEMDAFTHAASRPNCRINADSQSLALPTWPTRLSPIGKLLYIRAEAAAALGDPATVGRDLETLLRTGYLLRSSNLTMGVVVGAGFETWAYGLISGLLDFSAWQESDRRRWLSALDLRTRSLADEFAATNRLERAMFLKVLNDSSFVPIFRPTTGLANYGPFRRIFVARARLAACETLQGMVLSENGKLCATIDPLRVSNFQTYLRSIKSGNRLNSAEEFGLLYQFAVLGIQDGLIVLEEDRVKARQVIKIPQP